ncbi:unnamed protein product, partial [Rotaria magnacalcarata]
MQQLPPPQQIPPSQQQQQQPSPHQGYPMMHQSSGYPQAPTYGHPQQYRPPLSQRPAQYPPNVQWQQQQQQPP